VWLYAVTLKGDRTDFLKQLSRLIGILHDLRGEVMHMLLDRLDLSASRGPKQGCAGCLVCHTNILSWPVGAFKSDLDAQFWNIFDGLPCLGSDFFIGKVENFI